MYLIAGKLKKNR